MHYENNFVYANANLDKLCFSCEQKNCHQSLNFILYVSTVVLDERPWTLYNQYLYYNKFIITLEIFVNKIAISGLAGK